VLPKEKKLVALCNLFPFITIDIELIRNELIKNIFSFIDQQNSRRNLLLTCRAFLKLGFESFDKYIYTSASLAYAVHLRSFATIHHLCDPRVDPPLRLEKFLKSQFNSLPTIDSTKQQLDEAFEVSVLKCVKKILNENGKPMLIGSLGHVLKDETRDDYIKIREEFEGLLKLLQKYPDTFDIVGISPAFMISLKEGKVPSQPIYVPLKQQPDETFEAFVLKSLKKILNENGKPMLIGRLGHVLRYIDAHIKIKIIKQFQGLLNLLNKYPDTFNIVGTAPKIWISLKESKPSSQPDIRHRRYLTSIHD
jgi:hypothetical protein